MRYLDQVITGKHASHYESSPQFFASSQIITSLFYLIDVKTMVVVEKRSWDSFFPLEGGGRVHLKLQFILSAEEHKRIHEMVCRLYLAI